MEYTLQVDGVGKTYGSGKNAIHALRNVSLVIPPGEVVGLVGPNGAGKTTLLKLITGLTQPDGGRILLFGQQRDETTHRRIGFLPENPRFFKKITARELIVLSHRLCGGNKADRQVETVLSAVELLDAADRPVHDYSRGMRQRVGLAQALVHQPDFLILDEPMSGIDPSGRERVKSLLKDYCTPKRSVLFSSHDLGDVEDLCTRVVWVENGLVRLDAPIIDIQKQSVFEVHWQKRNRVNRRLVEDEIALWALLDEIRVSDGQLLRIQRGLARRIEELLEIGRRI